VLAWQRYRHTNIYTCSISVLLYFDRRNSSLMGGAIALSKQVKHRERSRKPKVSRKAHTKPSGWQVQPIGRPKIVDDQYLERLKELVSQSPRQLGYPFQRWTANWLRRHLEQETGTVVSDRHINRLLKQMGLSTRSQPHSQPTCSQPTTLCYSLDHANAQLNGQFDDRFGRQLDRQPNDQLENQPSDQSSDQLNEQADEQTNEQPDDSKYRIRQRHTQSDGSSSEVAIAAITIGDLHPSTTPKVLLLLD
jgi:transposase